MNIDNRTTRRALTAAVLVSAVAALTFWAAFQLSKRAEISAISPFAEDPPDIVASIAFQVALAGAALSLIRWARLAGDAEFSADRARLALRGCVVVAASIGITVVTDVVAVASAPPLEPSIWAQILIGGLAALTALGAAVGVTSAVAARLLLTIPQSVPTQSHTLGDLLDDAVTTAERAGGWIEKWLPPLGRLVGWIAALARRLEQWLNASWIGPRAHPWRFAITCALGAGVLLALAHLQEGLPPSLGVFVFVSLIFVSFETAAVIGGYALLGGWLGIRPPLWIRRT